MSQCFLLQGTDRHLSRRYGTYTCHPPYIAVVPVGVVLDIATSRAGVYPATLAIAAPLACACLDEVCTALAAGDLGSRAKHIGKRREYD